MFSKVSVHVKTREGVGFACTDSVIKASVWLLFLVTEIK